MSARILLGDCRRVLKSLPAKSVHAVITSPPYFGLRDYGTATWDGGEPGCTHQPNVALDPKRGIRGSSNDHAAKADRLARLVCRCGARRVDDQIGLEASPAAYVRTMVKVFREVRRVLRDDGTVWLNLGDSYAGGRCGARDKDKWPKQSRNDHMPPHAQKNPKGWRGAAAVGKIKPKDLIGIPWLVAFALRDDGWWLRQDNIFSKTNPMPESVDDRTTRAHEYLFQLCKRPDYFYDALAIAEPVTGTAHWRGTSGVNPKATAAPEAEQVLADLEVATTAPAADAAYRPYEGKNEASGLSRYVGFNERWRVKQNASFSAAVTGLVEKRNKRSVWTIASQPLSGPHFATFPEALAEPCLLAGTSAMGVCRQCGAPVARVVDRVRTVDGLAAPDLGSFSPTNERGERESAQGIGHRRIASEAKTIGWEATCACFKGQPTTPTVPATVLDPFCGSGTVGVVALKTGRTFIGIELSPDYIAYANQRMQGITQPLFRWDSAEDRAL